jgi:hypothetical protein
VAVIPALRKLREEDCKYMVEIYLKKINKSRRKHKIMKDY